MWMIRDDLVQRARQQGWVWLVDLYDVGILDVTDHVTDHVTQYVGSSMLHLLRSFSLNPHTMSERITRRNNRYQDEYAILELLRSVSEATSQALGLVVGPVAVFMLDIDGLEMAEN